ncbi:spore germination protein [Neobacillus sp. LXY-1]|uniref:spore germination protein n=1 Tax=Neobacillus sp. LXY-1 TaxID=3379133 RepID=UPI003EE0B660
MVLNRDGVSIGTISGGIVNFGGAICISPISITNSQTGSGGTNTGQAVARNARAIVSNNVAELLNNLLRSSQ